ncbi:MAG: DUF411 domain-containing protein [Gammaproteobacteria bacterium]|nr:DUF411 domain-containing protein [Gammaproteobacteria bacterium]NIN62014.1 DUF411 domain-containing protein [Gammaproteobacteria bacterium]NIO62093.1 DUF411 domain-containing protein [Gammaproteobacteria bacterium]NIQ08297.1 DUF411 domain-containing protein [Gammaproteobacteria bacterium]NIQ19805.1 DUF411 domain-containing protein [Gammaproteobacteria bacterium]
MKIKHLLLLSISLIIFTPANGADNTWQKDEVTYENNKVITVYRNPNCQCCKKWIDHLKDHEFRVNDVVLENINPVKARLGISPVQSSCHTAVIEDYFIEGHVPADDIERILLSRPEIRGLSVPGMPVGTPGMEMGQRKDPFTVIQIHKDNSTTIFNEYIDY